MDKDVLDRWSSDSEADEPTLQRRVKKANHKTDKQDPAQPGALAALRQPLADQSNTAETSVDIRGEVQSRTRLVGQMSLHKGSFGGILFISFVYVQFHQQEDFHFVSYLCFIVKFAKKV